MFCTAWPAAPCPNCQDSLHNREAPPRGIERKPDIAKIRVRHMLQLRQLPSGPDAHHRPIGVKGAVKRFPLSCAVCGSANHTYKVDEDAARHQQEVREKNNIFAGDSGMVDYFRACARCENNPYARKFSDHFGTYCISRFGSRSAPVAPDLQSATMPRSVATQPDSMSGRRPRMTLVG